MIDQIRHFMLKSNRATGGWGHGYVVIPKGHALYQVGADDLTFLNVHGGVTRSVQADSFEGRENVKVPLCDSDWIIGFDTCGVTDNQYNHSKAFVMTQTLSLAKQVRVYGCLRPQVKAA